MKKLLANFTGELTLSKSTYIVTNPVIKELSDRKRNHKSLTVF